MEELLALEAKLFLQACLLGAALGIVYDAFRILRMAIHFHTVFVFIQDVAYFIMATLITFGFFLAYNDGELRMFILFGELMGAVLYFFSLSVLILKLSKKIISLLKTVLRAMFFPICWLFKGVCKIFSWVFNKFSEKSKKTSKNLQLHLKSTVRLVYNKLVSKTHRIITVPIVTNGVEDGCDVEKK